MSDGAYGVLTVIRVTESLAQHPGGACALRFDVAVIVFDGDEGYIAFGTKNI